MPKNERLRIHLAGICGTGMASLAALLREAGHQVSGSDEGVYPPMSHFLADRGIPVQQGYHPRNLDPVPDLVVIGNALSRGNPEIEWVLNRRIPYTSFPEALKRFFLRGKVPVVVAGTHGKTTTTSMLSWGMEVAGLRPDFLIGGIAENFRSSYGKGGGDHFVVEGDEYDSAFFDKGPKFLHYLPYLAVIGNLEYDHADIYPDLESIKLQFRRLVHLIPTEGFLAVGGESPAALEACAGSLCARETFGLDPGCDWNADGIEMTEGRTCFDVTYRGKAFGRFRMQVVGHYNIRNALAATAVLHRLGVSARDIGRGLESFAGSAAGSSCGQRWGIRIYEDFAHHPRPSPGPWRRYGRAFRPERVWAVYEPRSATSRRNVFQLEIADALAKADCVAIPALFRPDKVPEGKGWTSTGWSRTSVAAAWPPGTSRPWTL